MKDSTKKAVDKAIDNYRDDMADAATAVVIEAHISGDIAAHAAMGIPIGKMEVQKEALLFGRKYKKLLKETGGTIIQGKRVDWLASHTEDTRKAVYETIRTGLIEGKPVADIGGKLSAPGTVAHDLEKLIIRDSKYKYVRIARTETAAIQNQGALNRFKKNKITHVEVIDGTDFDEACAEANGQIWTIEYASTHELEHPNCTRSFSPVIPDDWEAPDEVEKLKIPKTADVIPEKTDIVQLGIMEKPKSFIDKDAVSRLDLSADEISAVNNYTGTGYKQINAHAAGREVGEDAIRYTKEEVEKHISELDKAIGKSFLDEDVVLYRGINDDVADELLKAGMMKNGGFSSTTYQPINVKAFVNAKERTSEEFVNVLVMERRKGELGLFINDLEGEIILPRDAIFKVTKIVETETLEFTKYNTLENTRLIFVEAT